MSASIEQVIQAISRSKLSTDMVLVRAGVWWRICHLCFCATRIEENQCGACGGKVVH